MNRSRPVSHKASGFTLIELLVVIAIIAILAAMLFPVFARARESARKIQCLANVKNIATAVQMYLSDYDRFPPGMHDQGAQEWFNTAPGGGGTSGDFCWKAHSANPYLRWPVIFDEYVKNRDVWRCPSAKKEVPTTWIIPNYGVWWQYLDEHPNEWGRNNQYCSESGGGGPCCVSFPSGWGGTVTDSIAQRALASDSSGAFDTSIGVSGSLDDLKESQVLDPSWLIVTGDSMHWQNFNGVDDVLYYICRTNDCACADWANDPGSEACVLDANSLNKWRTDSTFRNKFTRHLGGSNVGFADGHAAWFSADALVAKTPYCDATSNWTIVREGRQVRGLCPAGAN